MKLYGTVLKEVVKCGCGADEYLGMMYWHDGHMCCRRCIESLWRNDGWQNDTPYQNAFEYYFPFYKDGIDYTRSDEK